jgi:hemerythrin-like domain-containing protein
LLAALRSALEAARAGGDVAALAGAVDAYAAFQWAHMNTEEEEILPLAERHLTDDDWHNIDVAFAANRSGDW